MRKHWGKEGHTSLKSLPNFKAGKDEALTDLSIIHQSAKAALEETFTLRAEKKQLESQMQYLPTVLGLQAVLNYFKFLLASF